MILTNDVDLITLYLYRWELEFAEFPYVYRWKKYLPEFYQRLCRILRLGTAMNSLLIEFEDGHQMVTSRNAIRRRFLEGGQ